MVPYSQESRMPSVRASNLQWLHERMHKQHDKQLPGSLASCCTCSSCEACSLCALCSVFRFFHFPHVNFIFTCWPSPFPGAVPGYFFQFQKSHCFAFFPISDARLSAELSRSPNSYLTPSLPFHTPLPSRESVVKRTNFSSR